MNVPDFRQTCFLMILLNRLHQYKKKMEKMLTAIRKAIRKLRTKLRMNVIQFIPAILIIVAACNKEDAPPPYFDPEFRITTYPVVNSSDQSFLIKPYMVFNEKIDSKIQSSRYEYFGYYKIKIDSAYISDSENEIIPSSTRLSLTHDTLFYKPNESFKSEITYNMVLTYSVLLSKDGKTFDNVMMKDGSPYSVTFTSSFKIRSYTYPEKIDTSYIDYAYPAPYQYHFHRNETNRGVLKIKDIHEFVSYLKDEEYKVCFYDMSGNKWESNVVFDALKKLFVFQIPTNNFEKEKIYKFELIKLAREDNNQSVLLSWHFRTSKFDRFEEKINTVTNIITLAGIDKQTLMTIPYHDFYLQESFDVAEGKPYSGLVRFEAQPVESNDWVNDFFNFYNVLRYKSSRYESVINAENRNKLLKYPPVNALTLYIGYLSPLLSSQQIIDNYAPESINKHQAIAYSLGVICYKDYSYFRNLLVNKEINTWEASILINDIHNLGRGTYNFKIIYVAGDLITYTSNVWSITY